MKCSDPVMLPNYFVPCGKCNNCLRGKAWIHTSMIVAERLEHGNATFVTLTYDDDNQPRNASGLGVLHKADIQLFLKRLRKKWKQRLRYYLVGEYGSRTQRPHYHLALFGYPNCHFGRSRFSKRKGQTKTFCCGHCNRIRDTWNKGIVELGELTPASSGYVAGYVSKSVQARNSDALKHLPPQFATMSLRPGLGHVYSLRYIRKLSEALEGRIRPQDIPRTFRYDGVEYRFSRNHRNVMRKWCGFPPKTSQAEMDVYLESYSTLPYLQEETPKTAFLDQWKGVRRNYETNQKVKHETF